MLLFKIAFQSGSPPFKAIPEHSRPAFTGFPGRAACVQARRARPRRPAGFSPRCKRLPMSTWLPGPRAAGVQSSPRSPLGPSPWPRAGIKKQHDMAHRSLGRQEDHVQCVPQLGCWSRERTSAGQLGKSKSSRQSS